MENFCSIYEKLTADSSNDEWIEALNVFANDNTISSNPDSNKEFILKVVSLLLKQARLQKPSTSFCNLILDCLRLAFRSDALSLEFASQDNFNCLLSLAERFSSDTQKDDLNNKMGASAENPVVLLSIPVMRCLTNLLNRSDQSIRLFHDPNLGVDGTRRLVAFLQRPLTASEGYYAVRLLHMISARSAPVACSLLGLTFSIDWDGQGMKTFTALEVFITTLELCLSSPIIDDDDTSTLRLVKLPVPFGEDRMSLASELCRLLYAIACSTPLLFSISSDSSQQSGQAAERTININDIYSRLTYVLCSGLCLSRDEQQVLDMQCIMLQILTHAPIGHPILAHGLTAPHCVQSLLHILHLQLNKAAELTESAARDNYGRTDTLVFLLSPILIVCTHVAKSSAIGRTALETAVFPDTAPPSDDPVDIKNPPMDPPPSPPDSLRRRLLTLMTALEPLVKRYSAELLLALCGEDENLFVRRCGFGNAIALLKTNKLFGLTH